MEHWLADGWLVLGVANKTLMSGAYQTLTLNSLDSTNTKQIDSANENDLDLDST